MIMVTIIATAIPRTCFFQWYSIPIQSLHQSATDATNAAPLSSNNGLCPFETSDCVHLRGVLCPLARWGCSHLRGGAGPICEVVTCPRVRGQCNLHDNMQGHMRGGAIPICEVGLFPFANGAVPICEVGLFPLTRWGVPKGNPDQNLGRSDLYFHRLIGSVRTRCIWCSNRRV